MAWLPCERQRLCQRCPNLGLLVASAQSATARNVIPHPAILHTCLHIPSHCPICSADHAGLHHPCLLSDLCWLVMAHVTDRRRQGVYIFRDERIGTGFGSYLGAWGRNHAINETVGMGTWGGACVAPRGRSKCGRVEKAAAQPVGVDERVIVWRLLPRGCMAGKAGRSGRGGLRAEVEQWRSAQRWGVWGGSCGQCWQRRKDKHTRHGRTEWE